MTFSLHLTKHNPSKLAKSIKGMDVNKFRGNKQQLYNFGTFYFDKLAQNTQTPKQLLVGAEDDKV